MFGIKIFVRVKTFRRVPPVLPRNFCHPVCYIWTKNYIGTAAGVEGMTTDHKMYLSHVNVRLCPLHGVKATRNVVSFPNNENIGNHKSFLNRDSAAGYPPAFRN